MKAFLFYLLVITGLGFSSVSQAGNEWKQVVNDIVYANSSTFREYPVWDREFFQEIRVQVVMGDLRIANTFLVTDMGTPLSLWQTNRDYRRGFSQVVNFAPTRLQSLRFKLQPLSNRPANLLVWIR